MPEENLKINPQITEIEIGVRNLRKVKVYPLSMADQMDMTDLITEGLKSFVEGGETMEEIEVIGTIVDLIKNNLGRILHFVTDEDGDELLKEISNEQFTTIAKKVYEINYEGAIKNVQGLFDQIKTQFQPKRPLPPSVNDIQDTDSNISTDSPILKEESHATNS